MLVSKDSKVSLRWNVPGVVCEVEPDRFRWREDVLGSLFFRIDYICY